MTWRSKKQNAVARSSAEADLGQWQAGSTSFNGSISSLRILELRKKEL